MKEEGEEQFPVPPGTRDLEQFITELEIEGGANLNKLLIGKGLKIETQNSVYALEHRSDGFYISGNSKYCPEPVKIEYIGSTLGGSAIRMDFIGRESILEIKLPGKKIIRTSGVKNIKEFELSPEKEK